MNLKPRQRLIYIVRLDAVVYLLLSTGQLVNLLVHEFDTKESLSREEAIVPLAFGSEVEQSLLEVESTDLTLSSCI